MFSEPTINRLVLFPERKYPNLCAICDNPQKCDTSDKYWGRKGPLYCLTDGAGDISWARLDDVKIHFGFVPGGKETEPEGYSLLCPDGSIRSLTNRTNPCIWVVKPWPVVATQRTRAQEVQNILMTLNRDENNWKTALFKLIETFRMDLVKVDPLDAIESYLARAEGFLNANSFSGCHPPRTIRICVKSIIEFAKCSWLRESAAVYGIEPDLECIIATNDTSCAQALNYNMADIFMATPDFLATAIDKYGFEALFYETVADHDTYITVAVVSSDSSIANFDDLKGKRACFPQQDGVAWNTVKAILTADSQCFGDYFSNVTIETGDESALKCVRENRGDVAFVSKNSLTVHQSSHRILCKDGYEGCFLSWAPIGQALIRNSSSELWKRDTLDVFLQLDNLFGRNYKSLTAPFQLFAPFDGQPDILFHDNTIRFRNLPSAKNFDVMKHFYGDLLRRVRAGIECSSSFKMAANMAPLLLVSSILLSYYL